MQSVAQILSGGESDSGSGNAKVPETADELRARLRKLNDVSEFKRRITPVDGPVVDGEKGQ